MDASTAAHWAGSMVAESAAAMVERLAEKWAAGKDGPWVAHLAAGTAEWTVSQLDAKMVVRWEN